MEAWLDTVGGLPVHPLVVHVVVVLVPLSVVGAVVMLIRPAFSRRFGILVVLAAVAGALGAFVAKGSGEQLAERVGEPVRHAELGTTLPVLCAVYAVVLVGFWLVDRGIPLNRRRPGWLVAVGVAMVALGLLAGGWTVVTGHSGAQATWSGVVGPP